MQIAQACDELLQAATNGAASYYSGTNNALPSILSDLGATSVQVASGLRYQDSTNQQRSFVFITMGQSRLGYGILWSPDDLTPDGSKWQLSVADEGGSTVLFETNKMTAPSLP